MVDSHDARPHRHRAVDQRQQEPGQQGAQRRRGGLVLLAIVWALVSYFVDTDKEKVEKGTRQFVQTAVDGVDAAIGSASPI